MRSLVIFMFIVPMYFYAMQPDNLIIPADKKVTKETLETAIHAISKLPLSKMKNSSRVFSEALFTLSAYWEDQFASQGLALAQLLMEHGADPHYQKLTQENWEQGKSSSYRQCFYEYRQTPFLVARG